VRFTRKRRRFNVGLECYTPIIEKKELSLSVLEQLQDVAFYGLFGCFPPSKANGDKCFSHEDK
jgi:hypothetical protein